MARSLRFKLGILGATGLVGQRLIERLVDHPWFEIAALAASPRSVGRRYADAVRWVLPSALPPAVGAGIVRGCATEELRDCELVLSALDAATAQDVEPAFRAAGFAVVSNSSCFRMDADVPLLVPEVNAGQLERAEQQRARHGGGFIVTNPNCSVIGLALGLAPLAARFGLRRVVVTTFQATSGAGLGGPAALELLDNVLPYIAGEEEKIERELPKILGRELVVSASCHRVAVTDGHLEAVSFELEQAVEPAEAERTLREFTPPPAILRLPSAIERPLQVRDEPDRPQPRLDRDAGGGMAVVVGRVRRCPVLGLKLALLSHNAIRGAAGGTLLVAELLADRGWLGRPVP